MLCLSALHGVQAKAKAKLVKQLLCVEQHSMADSPRGWCDTAKEESHRVEVAPAMDFQGSNIFLADIHPRHQRCHISQLHVGAREGGVIGASLQRMQQMHLSDPDKLHKCALLGHVTQHFNAQGQPGAILCLL